MVNSTHIKKLIDSISVRRWMSCTEKLPKKLENVLVSVDDDIFIAYHYDKDFSWKCYPSGNELEGVSYWMPLPKLPRFQEIDGVWEPDE